MKVTKLTFSEQKRNKLATFEKVKKQLTRQF